MIDRSGKLKPNLGRFDNPPDWQEILKYFRGNELQNYFTKVLEDNLHAVVKPQYVDQIPKAIKGPMTAVGELIKSRSKNNNLEEILDVLELRQVINRDVKLLSGGELQRFAIGTVCVQKAVSCTQSTLPKLELMKSRMSTCSTSLVLSSMLSSVLMLVV